MRRFRWILLAVVTLGSLVLAYLLRDLIYQLIIVPLAYTIWWAGLVYQAIPQLVKWIVLLVTLGVVSLWMLIPDLPAPVRAQHPRRPVEGRMETLAMAIHRAGTSNYFKWQLANRLGRLSRRMPMASEAAASADSVKQYLAAGLNQSFVDFPTPRGPFSPHRPTPLDIDPAEAIDDLESRMELNHDGRARSL